MTLSALAEDLKLQCYVGSGAHDPTPMWYTQIFWERCNFGTIYRSRPKPSRYAVAQDKHGDFLVFDLFAVQLNDDHETFTFPDGSVEVYPNINAALMAAKLQLA